MKASNPFTYTNTAYVIALHPYHRVTQRGKNNLSLKCLLSYLWSLVVPLTSLRFTSLPCISSHHTVSVTSARRSPECHPVLFYLSMAYSMPRSNIQKLFSSASCWTFLWGCQRYTSRKIMDCRRTSHVKADLCPAPGEPSLEKLLFAVMIKAGMSSSSSEISSSYSRLRFHSFIHV